MVLALGLAGPAAAASLPFTGSLAIEIVAFPPLGIVPGTGTAQVNGSAAGGHLTSLGLDAGVFDAEHLVFPVDNLSIFPIRSLLLTVENQEGAFAGSGGAGFGGAMPIVGAMKICLFSTCDEAEANLTVPLTVGTTATRYQGAAVNLTVVGAPWTTGTAAVGTVTRMGGVSPLSNTGAASGSVMLVTPIFISTNIGASPVLPTFGVLTLHFVPEPTTLALLGVATAGLAAFGRSRASRA
jgi:hypothetical protein